MILFQWHSLKSSTLHSQAVLRVCMNHFCNANLLIFLNSFQHSLSISDHFTQFVQNVLTKPCSNIFSGGGDPRYLFSTPISIFLCTFHSLQFIGYVYECCLLLSIIKNIVLWYVKDTIVSTDTTQTVYTCKLNSVTDYSGENMRLVCTNLWHGFATNNLQ